jgi:hypothetical protein
MRTALLLPLLLPFLALLGACETTDPIQNEMGRAPFRKFERALVIEGMNYNAAISVGIYDGLVEAGEKPDVVISACGASIANGILNAIPDREERLAYLTSESFHSFLKSTKHRDPRLTSALGNIASRLAGMNSRRITRHFEADTLPPLFDGYLLEVSPVQEGPIAQKRFSPDDSVRSVILGAKLLFGPSDVGQPRLGRRLYEEVFFTDVEIARALKGFLSPIGVSFPKSAVRLTTTSITGATLGDAIRVSISDPYLMAPIRLGKHYYAAGTIDLYPLEVAYEIANEVTTIFPQDFDFVEQSAIGSSFGIDDNLRLRQYTAMYARHWIDYSDFNEIQNEIFKPLKVDLLGNRITTNIPDDLTEFRRMVLAQWDLGRRRALEAVSLPPDYKGHIRGFTKNSASKETLIEVARQRVRAAQGAGWVQPAAR